MKFADVRLRSRVAGILQSIPVMLAVLLGSSEAGAFETLRLNPAAERVGVIVLAYNDDWTSYAGEWIYDKYLRLYMGKRYQALYISRGTKKGLTAEDIQAAFRAAMATGAGIDFMTSTHSTSSTIQLQAGVSVRPEDLLAPVLADEPGAADRLELAANFGCDSVPQVAQFERLGFRTYVGHEGISAGAVTMREFLKRWVKKCLTVHDASSETNTRISRFFKEGSLWLWIYTKITGLESYDASLVSSGDDLAFCE